MSGASAAAAVLQRPLLLHLPRPPRHIPLSCASLRTACGALRLLQPLKLPELPFLDWSEWRRHRGAPCLHLQRHEVRIFSAAGTGGCRLAARKSAQRGIPVIDARSPVEEGSHAGLVADPGAVTEEAAQAVALPKKRGRGRPKSSPLPKKNAPAELPDYSTAPSLGASLLGTTEGVTLTVEERKIPVENPIESTPPAVKPRRGRPKKTADPPFDKPDRNGVDECTDSTVSQKTKRSRKPKAAIAATGVESTPPEEFQAELPTGAGGGEYVAIPTISELSTSSSAAYLFRLDEIDDKLVRDFNFATQVAPVSMAPRASGIGGKGERIKRDEGPRSPSSHASSSISFVQILGTGMDTGDTSPSVLLFFDKRRFIFNAGEGLQRFCIEHKIKLSKIDHLFLTRVSSETANGIPGLLLTLAGIGDSKAPVDIWGTSELQYFVDAMRTFVPNASVVNTHSFGHGSSQANSDSNLDSLDLLYHDEYVKISATLLHPLREASGGQSNFKFRNASDVVTADSPRGQKRHHDSSHTTNNAGAECQPGDISVVYICELPEVRGRFDPAKATSLGIRPGRKYSDLQNGKSVPRDDNTGVVHPHEVMAPSSPGPIFVLVDCPTLEHIPSLLSKSCLDDFHPKQETYKTVSCMVHIGPATVTSDSKYQQWMAQFSETNHILAGHGLQNLNVPILKASARVISRLNYICPQVFPNCCLESEEQSEVGHDRTIGNQIGVPSKASHPQIGHSKFFFSKADNLLQFRLRPLSAMGLDCTSVPGTFSLGEVRDQLKTDIPEIEDVRDAVQRLWLPVPEGNVMEVAEVTTEATSMYPVEEPFLFNWTPMTTASCPDGKGAQKGASEISDSRQMDAFINEDLPDCLRNVQREEMEIIFLGTGSSQPSKYRNVSAILINLFNRGCVLLDCGEGTYGQLKRRYGLEGADAIVMGLKCVWISHIHADHHTGLSRILAVRRALLEKHARFTPVLVIGPRQLRRYLDAYSKLEDLGMVFLDCSHTTAEPDNEMVEVVKGKDGKVPMYDGGSRSPQRNAFKGLITSSAGKTVEGRAGSPTRNQMQNYWLQPGYNLASRDEAGQGNLRQVLASLGLQSLESVPVVHCPQAYGVILQSASRSDPTGLVRAGWKLAYSGDTRPCKKLLEACEGATVLIHEATFDDGMAEEAKMKRHSMTCEAIETGRLGNVFRTILTHFSQRYPKIPVFDESYTDRTCIAFDMMSVNLADLPKLPKLLPALKLLFRDDLIVAEEAAEDGELVEY